VIAGHGRVLACRQLGWTMVPTIQLGHLDPLQARAFMVADNRLAETSSWNEVLLAETLRDLSLAELDFELEAIGFDMGEIDLRIESLQPRQGRGLTRPIASRRRCLASPSPGWAISGSWASTACCAAMRWMRMPIPG
jgi:ParB-like chromosome segregation protein Spo0J